MPKNRKIQKKKWYIVDLTKKSMSGHYMLFNIAFDNKAQANMALKKNFGNKAYMFEVVSSNIAREFMFKFMNQRQHHYGYILKYDYPPERETVQERKSFRTKYRRWKRDYKMELNKIWA